MDVTLIKKVFKAFALLIVAGVAFNFLKRFVAFFSSTFSGITGWGDSAVNSWLTIAYVVIVIVFAIGVWQLLKGNSKTWPARLVILVMTVLVGAGFYSLFYGERSITDPAMEKLVDIRTNEPNYMVFKNQQGDWEIGYENRRRLHPRDCRPAGTPHRDTYGNIFPYATQGTCYSPLGDGSKMLPANADRRPDSGSFFSSRKSADSGRKDPIMWRVNVPQPQSNLPTAPIGAPTKVVVPRCGQGWAKIDIPSKWYINLSWSEAVATYQWRNYKTGQWQSTSAGGADAVKFCAKHKGYAGDKMLVTWSKM